VCPGAIELLFHGAVAALAVAAAQAFWNERPSGRILAAVALIGAKAATVQSLYLDRAAESDGSRHGAPDAALANRPCRELAPVSRWLATDPGDLEE
jgi:hypothetical protein